ncbi:M60 family metallopeptidase [Spiroplasma endosymbiont of Lariophagus distinguendus]|uniref:M60 family metallopeptidase n=1 Tax=Spiroplasma endosymbiont of Lariophagus distinguendus TaxID=2935082 RepID=UPI00207A93E6|nr:M60 family metallopeptidase [Spiroplasma endosymbiont of Lariophagus distinguendus]
MINIFGKFSLDIDIAIPENDKDLFSIFIGQWGIYQNLNNGQDLEPKEYTINKHNQTIISDLEGMLYLTNKSESNDYKVLLSVEKGIEVPTFVLDKTTNKEFQQILNDNINSPFVEIIGKHVFGTFQMKVAKDLWINNDYNKFTINETFTRLDKIYDLSNTVSGLSLNYDGVAYKFNNKFQISNPDTGPGYAAATNYRIIFEQNTGSGEALFKEQSIDDWYLWHEIGHTYQNQNYKWDGLDEVTVNINSLWIQRELGFENRLIKDNIDKEIQNFIFNSNINKNFDNQSVWVKLGLFWQLDQAYGKWFYPTLNQIYRLLDNNLLPTNNIEKQQLFIQITSKLVNQNLIPFFEKWGIKADENTKNIVNKYQNLSKNIWNNIFDGHYDKNAVIEYELPIYKPVQGVKIIGFLKKSIGDTISFDEIKNNISLQSNLKIKNINSISYQNPNFINELSNVVNFEVTDKNRKIISNKYKINIKLNLENSILLEGIGYDLQQYRGIINLNKINKTFFVSYNNEKIHDYFENQPYVGITIKDNNGNITYKKTAEGQDTLAIFQDINNIKYKDNYIFILYLAEPKRGLYFDSNIKEWIPSKENYVKFIVDNNKLIKK